MLQNTTILQKTNNMQNIQKFNIPKREILQIKQILQILKILTILKIKILQIVKNTKQY